MPVYAFVQERVNGQAVQRPKVPVWLKHENERMRFFALLDSGSDTTVIPEPVAKFLKLDYDTTRKEYVESLHGTKFPITKSAIDITFIAGKPEEEIALTNVPVFVALGSAVSRFDVDVILGVEGIFDHVDVLFRKRKNQIVLER